MIYKVIWKHSAKNRLTSYYVRALEDGLDTGAITDAIAQIDLLLQNDPLGQGK